jgi:site-specific DNA-methyltransferase (adenine-specific)
MGIGKTNNFKSETIEYSTPNALFAPLAAEFNLQRDVCASPINAKLPRFWTKEDNALRQDWIEHSWMNPPFNRELSKWVRKAHDEAAKYGNTIVCLIPVRSNTKWWRETIGDAEVRFINGEVNFNDLERGLWLPMCIVIFGQKAHIGHFSFIDYR